MDEMDYRSMVVEAQIVVDATKNKQKGKSVETEGQSEDLGNFKALKIVKNKV
jgi:hypothetical protein